LIFYDISKNIFSMIRIAPLAPGCLFWPSASHIWSHRCDPKHLRSKHIAPRGPFYGSHALTNHAIFVYISAYFLAEGGGRYQALHAVTCQTSFPG
jgi:hypothetical protein